MESISIIVPVFNTKQTLDKCFQSIVNQTWKEFKVIVVDDMSIDGSYELCKKWEKIDNRFLVMRNSTNTHGPSKVRNIGLNEVSTHKVTFVDSDDWLEPTHLENMMSCGNNEVCSVLWTKQNTAVSRTKRKTKQVTRDEYICKALGMKTVSGYLCTKMFNMDIINRYNLRLDEKIRSSEDLLFTIEYLQHIKIGTLVSKPATYHYITRRGSLTQTTSKNDKDLYAELDTVRKIESLLKPEENIKIRRTLQAHFVKTQYNIFLQYENVAVNKKEKLVRHIRHQMLKGLAQYCISTEFTFQSKILIFMAVFFPEINVLLRKYKRGRGK